MISIIIPSINHILTEYCLCSLDLQRYKEFEVIIVISTDDELEASKIESVSTKYPFAVMIHSDRKNNRSAARNCGIRAATAETLLFLDEDMIVNPMFSSCLFTVLEKCFLTNYMAYSGRKYMEPGMSSRMLRGEVSAIEMRRWLLERECSYDDRQRESIIEAKDMWQGILTNNLCVPKSFIEKNDLYFDEAFEGWGEEDIDWAYRAYLSGAISVSYENVSWHVSHEFSCSRRKLEYCRNARYMVHKHPGILGYRGELYQKYGVEVSF